MRSAAAFVLLCCALLAKASAAEIVSAGLSDAVPGHPGLAYLDLVRQIAPDLAPAKDGSAAGHLAAELHFADGEWSADAGEPVTIDHVTALALRAEGKEQLALLVDLGDGGDRAESFTALALYDDAPTPKLLDIADASYDQFTIFGDPPLLDLSADDQAILVRNTRSNSNQDSEVTEFLFIRNDRIAAIGDVLAFSDWNCKFKHRQTSSFDTVPDPGKPYAGVRASVLDEVVAQDENYEGMCGDNEKHPTLHARTVSATWRWDAGAEKFVADSDALEELAKDDTDRF
jgi:hypothetical protein